MTISTEKREQLRQAINRYSKQLQSPGPGVRGDGCEALYDLFFIHFDYYRGAGCEELVASAMKALLEVAAKDQDQGVVEASLLALRSAITWADAEPALVNWAPLVARLDWFDQLEPRGQLLYEYVFPILASTGDPKHRVALMRFIGHPRELVRLGAREELLELDTQINVQAGRRAFDAGLDETQALEQAKATAPLFQANNVLVGYYVRPNEMGDRTGASWLTYRTALNRLNLPDLW